MLEITYLTVDDLKSYTAISKNNDVTQLENFIPVAETMFINESVLGTALDSALKQELTNTGTLTGNNATLWVNIKNCSAWYSYFLAIGFIRTKTTNKGETQQSSDNSQVAPLEDYKDKKQGILDIASFYRNYLIDYLDKNKSLFPLYRADLNDCGESTKKDNSSGIFLG